MLTGLSVSLRITKKSDATQAFPESMQPATLSRAQFSACHAQRRSCPDADQQQQQQPAADTQQQQQQQQQADVRLNCAAALLLPCSLALCAAASVAPHSQCSSICRSLGTTSTSSSSSSSSSSMATRQQQGQHQAAQCLQCRCSSSHAISMAAAAQAAAAAAAARIACKPLAA
jgi:hypothetical protein